MGFHVHAHFIVPGGGISPDGNRWLPAQRDHLMPEKAVANILRDSSVANVPLLVRNRQVLNDGNSSNDIADAN